MAVNSPTPPRPGIAAWLEANPTFVIGGAILLALLGGGIFLKKGSGGAAQNATTTPAVGDLSGLAVDSNGNHIVYRDAADSFYNYSDVQGSYNTTQTSTSTTTTTTNPPPGHIDGGGLPPPSIHPTPIPQPAPIPKPTPTASNPRRIWDQRHVVRSGETLSGIAQGISGYMQAHGSGSVGVTWMELYQHNQATIDSAAAAHHNPIAGGPWNDIFPGEVLVTPRWYTGP